MEWGEVMELLNISRLDIEEIKGVSSNVNIYREIDAFVFLSVWRRSIPHFSRSFLRLLAVSSGSMLVRNI